MFNIYGKYTSATIYAEICEADALSQIYDLCNHPKLSGASIKVMPDVHAGAGATIGTTVKMSFDCVIPSIVGTDIGCGVLTVIIEDRDIDFKSLDDFILEYIPFGMRTRPTTHRNMQNSIKRRVRGLCERLGMTKNEHDFLRSCGTLGGGNHYIEIGRLSDGKIAITIHTGSRSLGKCIAEYYNDKANNYLHNNSICGVNRSLPYLCGNDAIEYLFDMCVATDFAAENRRLIALDILKFLDVSPIETFDTVHNYVEENSDGSITVRKGAISAKNGERIAIPMNMRDGVLLCVGIGNREWNYSAPHGAGRLMSRSEAKSTLSLCDYNETMRGIATWSVGLSTIDESPMAYKPMESITSVIAETVNIVDVIKPLYNFKARSISGK